MLVIKISEPLEQNRTIDTGHLKEQVHLLIDDIRGEVNTLQQRQRIDEMLQHVAADDQIGHQFRDVAKRIEQRGAQLKRRHVFRLSAMRVKSDIAAVRMCFRKTGKKMPVTMPDL